jgi:3-phenylpropionate/trans-cinnamate dioxygenase ferredoxin reductase subunit
MADHEYTYLIVGGGMAADAAARGIREVDPHGAIGLIGAEPDPPYKRPPLSKKLWHGKPLGSIWLETESLGVDLHLGHAARVPDLRQKIVVDDRGTVFGFDKLLLATGVAPGTSPSAAIVSSPTAPSTTITACARKPSAGNASP